CQLNPRVGAMHAVAEAARNVACSGAHPIAATNCLNFGSPEKPEAMWQFSETIDGIADACTALGTPITGGNVSFYNETLGKSIYPTPVIGVLGILDDASHVLKIAFRNPGDPIVLLDASVSSHDSVVGAQHVAPHLGAIVNIEGGLPSECALFGERGARCIVSLPTEKVAALQAIARQYGVAADQIGQVTGDGSLRIKYMGRTIIDSPI